MPKRIIQKTSITDEQKLSDLLLYTKPDNGCMVWIGAVNTDGYACMFGNVKVHRYVYELKSGQDITGSVVRHTCDCPLCINPDHLLIGSFGDNNRDRAERGRSYRSTTPDKIARTLKLLETKALLKKEIAAIVGIDSRRVSDISNGLYSAEGRFLGRG